MKIQNILNNFIENTSTYAPFYEKREYFISLEEGLVSTSLQETNTSTDFQNVVNSIKNRKWDSDPERFYNSFMKSKHPKMLTPYSVEELSQMKLFKVPHYDIGFALKQWKDGTFSEVVAVHNNDSRVKGIGDVLAKATITEGGRYLDHFDGILSDLYSKAGFSEYQRYGYDPQYDPDSSFKDKYGALDVVYRHHNSVPRPED